MIRINDESFLYDVQGLVRAFFPAGEPEDFALSVTIGENELTVQSFCGSEPRNGRAVSLLRWQDEDTVEGQLSGGTGCGGEAVDYTHPEAMAARKENKNRLKRAVYEVLSEETGKELPWGTLSGIRPVKLARMLLEETAAWEGEELPSKPAETALREGEELPSMPEEEGRAGDRPNRWAQSAVAQMKKDYLCSGEKAHLAVSIAAKEAEIIEHMKQGLSPEEKTRTYSLYLGIPFCPSTCLYCSFPSYAISSYKKQVRTYLDAVKKEIDFVAEEIDGGDVFSKEGRIPPGRRLLTTVYFGGGTPTSLSAEELEELLSYLEGKLLSRYQLPWRSSAGETGEDHRPALFEYTVEAGRPDSITPKKLKVLKKYGVNRLSVNPQTMKEETLRLIGRHHTNEDIYRAMTEAKAVGFPVINMDLILGLPGETLSDVEETLKKVCEMRPDNLTVHSLAIKRSSRLNIQWDEYRAYQIDNSQAHMELAYAYAKELCMEPYYLYRQQQMAGNLENVGFAPKGKEGLYNILIIEEVQDIVAIGAGAACKKILWGTEEGTGRIRPVKTERCENVKDITQYLRRLPEMIDRKRELFITTGTL